MKTLVQIFLFSNQSNIQWSLNFDTFHCANIEKYYISSCLTSWYSHLNILVSFPSFTSSFPKIRETKQTPWEKSVQTLNYRNLIIVGLGKTNWITGVFVPKRPASPVFKVSLRKQYDTDFYPGQSRRLRDSSSAEARLFRHLCLNTSENAVRYDSQIH